jgi:hypothetical protein
MPGALSQDVALDARRNRRPHLSLARPPPTTPGHLPVAFSESSTDARAPSRSQPGSRRYLPASGASPLPLSHSGCPHRHVSRLYERIARRKGHPKAVGAVPRHLAEATYWLLSKQEAYREPQAAAVSSTGDTRDFAMSFRKLEF